MTTCIRHPINSQFINVHAWMVEFCKDNHCAAFILSHFIAWHNWKLVNDTYYKRMNDVAEQHGDGRPYEQNAYLFFTIEDLEEGILRTFRKTSIKDALSLLESLKAITIHKNPNKRYHFDKTRYFRFFPEVCNQWIDEKYNQQQTYTNKTESVVQVIDNYDIPKTAHAFAKNGRPSAKNGTPSAENGRPITDNTNNKTNNIQSIAKNHFSDSENQDAEEIVQILIQKGMEVNMFNEKAFGEIKALKELGATAEHFIEAYEIANNITRSFNFVYLTKVVKSLLIANDKNKDPPCKDNFSKVIYRSNVKNAAKWIEETESL